MLYVGERSEREQCQVLSLQRAFSHFPCYPQVDWPFWCWFLGRWLCVYSRTPWVSPTSSSVWLGVSSTATSPTGFYSQRFWGFRFPRWNPGLLNLSNSPIVPPGLSTCKCAITRSASHHLATLPLCPSCPSATLLPVWMNVSSLIPWLLNFYTVVFSGSSGCFLFLN